jgi:hypothetical protein
LQRSAVKLAANFVAMLEFESRRIELIKSCAASKTDGLGVINYGAIDGYRGLREANDSSFN